MEYVQQFISEYLEKFTIPLKHERFICNLTKLQEKYGIENVVNN